MENPTKKIGSKVMIIANDDFVGGVEKGYYNEEYEDQIECRNLCFMTRDEALKLQRENTITNIPRFDGEVFIWNPYKQMYIPVSESNLEENFITAEAIGIKRALQNMGAHCVILEEEIKDSKEKNTNVHIDAKAGLKGGAIDTHINNSVSINLRTSLRFLYPQNHPIDISKIKDYLTDTGLINNDYIRDFFKRIQEDGVLHGTEFMEIRFLSDLKSAVDIAANLDYGPIEANIKFSYDNIHIHEQVKTLRIYFDDVPISIRGLFE